MEIHPVFNYSMNANINIMNNYNEAHLAASEGHIECLRLLVYYNNTPLLVLTSRNNLVR